MMRTWDWKRKTAFGVWCTLLVTLSSGFLFVAIQDGSGGTIASYPKDRVLFVCSFVSLFILGLSVLLLFSAGSLLPFLRRLFALPLSWICQALSKALRIPRLIKLIRGFGRRLARMEGSVREIKGVVERISIEDWTLDSTVPRCLSGIKKEVGNPHEQIPFLETLHGVVDGARGEPLRNIFLDHDLGLGFRKIVEYVWEQRTQSSPQQSELRGAKKKVRELRYNGHHIKSPDFPQMRAGLQVSLFDVLMGMAQEPDEQHVLALIEFVDFADRWTAFDETRSLIYARLRKIRGSRIFRDMVRALDLEVDRALFGSTLHPQKKDTGRVWKRVPPVRGQPSGEEAESTITCTFPDCPDCNCKAGDISFAGVFSADCRQDPGTRISSVNIVLRHYGDGMLDEKLRLGITVEDAQLIKQEDRFSRNGGDRETRVRSGSGIAFLRLETQSAPLLWAYLRGCDELESKPAE